jgi:hypothetical protein
MGHILPSFFLSVQFQIPQNSHQQPTNNPTYKEQYLESNEEEKKLRL